MKVRHLALYTGTLMLVAGMLPVHAADVDYSKFKVLLEPQYIAALAEPTATSGSGAQSWGL